MKHSLVMRCKTNINDSIHTHEGIKQATKEQNKRTNQHNKQARTHTLAVAERAAILSMGRLARIGLKQQK